MSDADVVIRFSVDGRPAEDGAARVGKGLDNVRQKADATERAVGALGNAFRALLAGVTFSKMISEVTEAEGATKQFEASVISTGRASQQAAGQIRAWAANLEDVGYASEEAGLRLAGMMLQMRNVRLDQFQSIMQAAADVSAKTGMSFEEAGRMIARSLNNPTQAARNLRALNIQLTEGQQNLLEQMVKTGRTTEAQALLMGQLERAYGGAAAAARNTLGGALKALSEQFGDIMKFGQTDITTSLRGGVEQLILLLKSLEPLSAGIGQALSGIFSAATGAIKIMTDNAQLGLAAMAGATVALLGPFNAVAGAVVLLAGYMWQNRDAVLGFVADSLTAFGDFYNGFRAMLSTLGTVFDAWITALVDGFMNAGRQIGEAFSNLPGRLMDNAKAVFSGGSSKGVGDLFGSVNIGGAFGSSFDVARAKIDAQAATAAQTNYAQQELGLENIIQKTRQLGAQQREVLQTQRQTNVQTGQQVGLQEEIGELTSEQLQRMEEMAKKNREQLATDEAKIERLRVQLQIVNMTDAQQAQILAIYDRQVELKKRGVDLTSEQARREVENVRQAGQLEEALGRANRERDALLQPLIDGAKDIEEALTGAIDNFVRTGKIKIGDLGQYIRNVFAQLVTGMLRSQVIQPMINQVLGAISPRAAAGYGGGASGGLTGGIANIGSILMNGLGLVPSSGIAGGLFSQGLAKFGNTIGSTLGFGSQTLTAAFGNSPYGALGGMAASMLGLGGGIGGTVGNIAGSLVGGGIGSSMGTILGMAGGPVGAIIGGFLGSAVGGLFGNKKPSNAWATANLDVTSGTASYWHPGKGNSAENMKTMQGNMDAVMAFIQNFNTLGVGRVTGRIQGELGTRDTGYANVTGELGSTRVAIGAGDYAKFATESLKAILRLTNITDSNVRTAVQNGDYTDLNKLLGDAQFGANFRSAVMALREGYDLESDIRRQARESVSQLNQQLSGFLDNTKRLGLSMVDASSAVKTYVDNLVAGRDMTKVTNETEAAVVSLRAQWEAMTPVLITAGYTAQQAAQLIQQGLGNNLSRMTGEFNKSVQNEILQITDPGRLQLIGLDEWYEAMKKSAAVVGGDLVKLEELYGLKRREILEQSVGDITKASQTIREYITRMQLGQTSSLNDTQRLQLAQQQFRSIYDMAYQSGSATMVGDVTGAAETLRTQLRDYYASGADYAAGERYLVSLLQALERRIGGSTTADSSDPVVQELRESRDAQTAGLGGVSNSVETLAQQISLLTTRLDRLVAGQTFGGR